MLRVGDKVRWSHGWGSEAYKEAEVSAIEIDCEGKYGTPVKEAPWSKVRGRNAIVILTNGHWAYGFQLREKVGATAPGGNASVLDPRISVY